MGYDVEPGNHPLIEDWLSIKAAEGYARGNQFLNASDRQLRISRHLFRALEEVAVEIVTDETALHQAQELGILFDIASYLANLFDGQNEITFWLEQAELQKRRRALAFALIEGDMETAQSLTWATLQRPAEPEHDRSPSAMKEFNKTMASELADCEAINAGKPLPSKSLPPAPKRGRGRPRKQL